MRMLVFLAGALLLLGCGSREGGGAGASVSGGPPPGDGYDAPRSAPEGTSKLLGGGDNDPGFPPDAHEYLDGPALRGTVRNGEGLAPMKGFTVGEYEAGGDMSTGADGVFLVTLKNEALPAIHVRGEGFVPTIQISSEQSRLYFDGEYKIEVFGVEDEKAVLKEDFGVTWSDGMGQLVVNLQPMGSPKGVAVVLEPTAPSWIYGPGDVPETGNKLPSDDSGAGEVVYPSLKPGSYAIEVTVPEGLTCSGPAAAPVVAGTYTRAYFFCVEEGKAPRTATSGPEDAPKPEGEAEPGKVPADQGPAGDDSSGKSGGAP